MSVQEIIGIIRLSYRQAEGRRVNLAVLCLKYILSLLLTASVVIVGLKSELYGEAAMYLATAVAALISVYMRGDMLRKLLAITSEFLCVSQPAYTHTTDAPAVLSGELVYIASVWTLFTVMLSPSYICLRFAISYYSLSSDRQGFMLIFSAAVLLASGGILFALVLSVWLNCAEYLFLSGQCRTMTDALIASHELTRGSCGDLLRLRLLTLFCGNTIRSLCMFNFSRRLLRKNGFPTQKELYIDIVSDVRGEKHFELI